jgi:pyruvate kinase
MTHHNLSRDFLKQTKIVATISDRRCDVDFLARLWEEGMDAVRLNTAHQSPSDTLKVVENVRALSDRIPIIIDTKGPEIRTAGIDGTLEVKEGQELLISRVAGEGIQVTYSNFIDEVPDGASILIDDGLVEIVVLGRDEDGLLTQVRNSGSIGNKKSVNVPDIPLDLPSLTGKDRQYIDFAIEHDIDFIAHSFVRGRKDVEEIQKILDKKQSAVKIIAKIENQQGVDNIDEILEAAFGIMIARGDLGIEIEHSKVPGIQKRIINACIRKAKPVITATQMLHTMIENPRPTRAEVSDVANAIYDGTDALMLSGETAYGDYPEAAVRTMSGIAASVEKEKPKLLDLPVFEMKNKLRNYLAKAAVSASLDLPIKAMVCDTDTGLTARIISAYRGQVPVYAKSIHPRVVREMGLSYGIHPSGMSPFGSTDDLVTRLVNGLLEEKAVELDDQIVFLAETPGTSEGHNFIEINTARLCLGGRERDKKIPKTRR